MRRFFIGFSLRRSQPPLYIRPIQNRRKKEGRSNALAPDLPSKGSELIPFVLFIFDRVDRLASRNIPDGQEACDSGNEEADHEHQNDLSRAEIQKRHVKPLIPNDRVEHGHSGDRRGKREDVVDEWPICVLSFQ